jgi:predicted flap endonuclease-1-like 5' DNA nuclease
MVYLLSSLFVFILAAFVVGLVVGWMSCKHEPRKEGLGWMWYGLAAFVFGLFISATKWIKGSAGLWFDTLMWLAGAYLLGCLIGCMISQWLRPAAVTPVALSASDKLTMLPGAAVAAAAVMAAPKPMPAAIRPYQWQAAKDAASVTLTGYVPTEEARGRVTAAAKSTLAPAAVIDKLQIGAGAPSGLEGMASTAYGHLGKLDKGIASLIDAKYTLTGIAGTQANYDGVMAGVRALPAGYSLAKADIVAPPAATAPKPVAKPAPAPAPKAAPVAVAAVAPAKPMPKPAAKIAGEDKVPGKRPPGYAKPIDGKADDLKRIRGIGQQNEGRLHGLGIWHFAQVAKWSAQECLWVGSYLAFPGRIEREEWVKQAKQLAMGKDTQFSRRVAKGLVATSQDKGDKGQKNVEVVKPMRAQKGVAPKGTKK